MKDHEIAALVNALRDVAVEFHDSQQLRERISQLIVPALKQEAAVTAQREQDAFDEFWLTNNNQFSDLHADTPSDSAEDIWHAAWKARGAQDAARIGDLEQAVVGLGEKAAAHYNELAVMKLARKPVGVTYAKYVCGEEDTVAIRWLLGVEDRPPPGTHLFLAPPPQGTPVGKVVDCDMVGHPFVNWTVYPVIGDSLYLDAPSSGDWIAADDYYRNVKELDEALNGEGGASKPSIVDVLAQVQGVARRLGMPVLRALGNRGEPIAKIIEYTNPRLKRVSRIKAYCHPDTPPEKHWRVISETLCVAVATNEQEPTGAGMVLRMVRNELGLQDGENVIEAVRVLIAGTRGRPAL